MFKSNISELSPVQIEKMQKCGVWLEDCPIHYSRLRLINFKHYDFENNIKDGSIVVLDVASESTVSIFHELFKKHFPIKKAVPIEEYKGSDDDSMFDNNTSCFNYRKIEGSSDYSIHSYGLAIDVNPVQNPFIIINTNTSELKLYPKNSWGYINRRLVKEGMVEDIVSLFAKHQFKVWGGDWTEPIDYHHFQVPRKIAEKIANLDFSEGKKLFETYKV